MIKESKVKKRIQSNNPIRAFEIPLNIIEAQYLANNQLICSSLSYTRNLNLNGRATLTDF
jgi:hypothetical protein